MNIKEIIYQHRRDFTAIYECEHCGNEHEAEGYDDKYFHENVIPKMECPECSKRASDKYKPFATKYPEGMSV